jgi:hypothetical protein
VVTPTPVTVAQFRKRMKKPGGPDDDAEMQEYLHQAAAIAEEWRNTGPIVAREFTDRVTANDRGRVVLLKRPVLSITSLTPTDGSAAIAGAELEFDPDSGIVGRDGGLSGDYDALWRAGHELPVPEHLHKGVLEIAVHLWQTQRGPRGGARNFVGATEDDGAGYERGVGYLIPHRAATALGGGRPVVM